MMKHTTLKTIGFFALGIIFFTGPQLQAPAKSKAQTAQKTITISKFCAALNKMGYTKTSDICVKPGNSLQWCKDYVRKTKGSSILRKVINKAESFK